MASPIRLPSPPQTMCASGGYTTMVHSATNAHTAPNFMRPAREPVIMAVVIMQNAIWKMKLMMVGYVASSGTASASASMSVTPPRKPS